MTSDIPLFANLKDDDPTVVAAVAEARRTVRQFLAAATQQRLSPATYLVKLPFLDRSDSGRDALVCTDEIVSENPGGPTCHLWLVVTSVLADLVFCSVREAPSALNLKNGTSFVVGAETVEDWMIYHNGDVYGGFSLRVIRKRLRGDEKLKFDQHTGIRQFKDLII